MTTILHVNTSGRNTGSHSRKLSTELIAKLTAAHPNASVIERDIASGIEFVDQTWIEATFTPETQRSSDQKFRLSGSDTLVGEVQAADQLVIAVPIYNFSIPGVLKAWVDQICRIGVTFKHVDGQPVGLLENKKAFLVITSGGTEVQGPVDFATDYMTHVLAFIGITDVAIINAGQLMFDESGVLAKARQTIAAAA